MLLDFACSLMLAGIIMMIVGGLRYLRDHRCPQCRGDGIIPLWDGSSAGCPYCKGTGYDFTQGDE